MTKNDVTSGKKIILPSNGVFRLFKVLVDISLKWHGFCRIEPVLPSNGPKNHHFVNYKFPLLRNLLLKTGQNVN